jgi:hypothetical protein
MIETIELRQSVHIIHRLRIAIPQLAMAFCFSDLGKPLTSKMGWRWHSYRDDEAIVENCAIRGSIALLRDMQFV